MTHGQAARGRQPDPRRQGARRPLRERRVRGRQERAGVRRGPDPDARGADQERHDHRREPLDRPRPDRLDGQRRERRRQGDVHDRRLDRGQARRGPDLEREPGRARPARQEEGREGRRAGARRRLHLQDRQHHAEGAGATPWTGPTNSRLRVRDAGPQVVNDSKTPSGTVHVGSLRGPVILDAITRALRANGIETTLLYGVDDLDPMDAQALLTPDAVDDEMGRPLAHVPDQDGDGHASYARHHAQTFIDTFAGLGIHPDRYYWMSDIYPTGDMDPFIRTALDRAARRPRHLPPRRQRPASRHVAPDQRHLRELRQGRDDDRHASGTASGSSTSAARTSSTWAQGLRRLRLGLAVRRPREAAVEPRMGRPVVAVRGDDRAQRQGPRDGRWLARPVRRDRPRGVRARAAAQRPVRVPQHRRQEDVDLEGPRRRRARDRRGRAAGAAPLPVPAPSAEPRHRLRSRGHRPDPAPVRRVRQVRRGRRPGARSGASCRRATRRRSATRCWTRTPTSPPRPPRSGRRSATSRCSSRSRASTSSSGVEAEKGSALTDRERAILDERAGAARAWLETYAPEIGAARPSSTTPSRRPPPSSTTDQRAFLARPRRARPSASTPHDRRRLAGADLRRRRRQVGRPRPARLRGDLPRLPRPAERPARRLAPGQPRSDLRQRARPRGIGLDRGRRHARPVAGGWLTMSVGLQRLREEPDVIRKGAIDKGEDPALVDRALRARRRAAARCSARARPSRPSATRPRSASARPSRAAPSRTAPRSRSSRPRRSRPASGSRPSTPSLAETEADLDDLLLRIPNPADPDVPVGGEEANVTVRTWGELLAHDEPLEGEVGADAPAGGATWAAQAALGARRGARHHRQRRAARRSPAPGSPSTRARARRSSAG